MSFPGTTLSLQGIANLPIRDKYGTKAAAYYRQLLKSEVEGLPPPPPLQGAEGKEPELGPARTMSVKCRSGSGLHSVAPPTSSSFNEKMQQMAENSASNNVNRPANAFEDGKAADQPRRTQSSWAVGYVGEGGAGVLDSLGSGFVNLVSGAKDYTNRAISSVRGDASSSDAADGAAPSGPGLFEKAKDTLSSVRDGQLLVGLMLGTAERIFTFRGLTGNGTNSNTPSEAVLMMSRMYITSGTSQAQSVKDLVCRDGRRACCTQNPSSMPSTRISLLQESFT